MTAYNIYIVDPMGGGMTETEGAIIVRHSLLGKFGAISVSKPPAFNPGELRVTIPCINHLGESRVLRSFVEHLTGTWWNDEQEDIAENLKVIKRGQGVIYNLDRKRGVYLITYIGDNSTLITREEY